LKYRLSEKNKQTNKQKQKQSKKTKTKNGLGLTTKKFETDSRNRRKKVFTLGFILHRVSFCLLADLVSD